MVFPYHNAEWLEEWLNQQQLWNQLMELGIAPCTVNASIFCGGEKDELSARRRWFAGIIEQCHDRYNWVSGRFWGSPTVNTYLFHQNWPNQIGFFICCTYGRYTQLLGNEIAREKIEKKIKINKKFKWAWLRPQGAWDAPHTKRHN